MLGPSCVESRFEALRAATTPLIGRGEELELLLRRWRQVAHGEGRVVLLSGEPGIGKSRLTVALRERLQAELHIRLSHSARPTTKTARFTRSLASSNGRPTSGTTTPNSNGWTSSKRYLLSRPSISRTLPR